MATRTVWWLIVASAFSAKHIAFSDQATRSHCYNQHEEAEDTELLQNVTILDLQNRNITTLNVDNMKCYPNLQQLNLNNNRIGQIGDGAFDSSVALQNLFIEGNAFLGKQLSPKLFRKCLQLRAISFSGNNMSDTPEALLRGLYKLESLYMNSCSLLVMPPLFTYSVFRNLKRLQLASNKISRIDYPATFVNVRNLESIYLSNNEIFYLHEDLLKPLKAIVHIFLPGNRIRYIPEGFFHNKSSLIYINLAYNFIENVPVEAFFGTGLKLLNLSGNRLTYLSDQFCTRLRGIGVSLEHFYFRGNPWQCSCLNELLVETKKLNILYKDTGIRNVMFSYDGKHPVCIMTDSYKCHRIEVYQNLFYNVINGG